MVKDVRHFLNYLLTIYTFSLDKCLLILFAHLLIGLIALVVFNFLSFYISWIFRWIAGKTFLPFCRLLFYILLFFAGGSGRIFLIWCNSIHYFLILFLELLESYSESHSLCLHLEVFSHSSFKVLGLTLRPFIDFELSLWRVRDKDLVSVFHKWLSSLPSTTC
jgi:hypothetical protein